MTITSAVKPMVEVSEIEERVLPDIGMRYLVMRPAGWTGKRTVVAIHGISRNHKEHAQLFAPACAEANAALIVPRFSNSGYRGYQRLRRGKRGLSADQALIRVLADAETLLQRPVGKALRLFGFSGGAQFVHRFSMAHPGLVARQALASAGFYTFPTLGAEYPYGLDTTETAVVMDPRGLLIPTRVFVGDLDTERDQDLRVGAKIDRTQGRHRVDRAQRFVLSVRAYAARSGHAPDCSLSLLSGCAHEFGTCAHAGLVDQTLDFLLASPTR